MLKTLIIAAAATLIAAPAFAQTTRVDRVIVPAGITPCSVKAVSGEAAKREIRRLRRAGFMVTVRNVRTGAERTSAPASFPPAFMEGRIAVSGC